MSGVIQIDTRWSSDGGARERNRRLVRQRVTRAPRASSTAAAGRWLASRRGAATWICWSTRSTAVEGEFTPRYHDVFAKADYDVSERTSTSRRTMLFARDDVEYVQDDNDTLIRRRQLELRVGNDQLRTWATRSPAARCSRSARSSGSSVLTEAVEPSGEFSFADNRAGGSGRRRAQRLGVARRPSATCCPGAAELRNLDANYDYFLEALRLRHPLSTTASRRIITRREPPRSSIRTVTRSDSGPRTDSAWRTAWCGRAGPSLGQADLHRPLRPGRSGARDSICSGASSECKPSFGLPGAVTSSPSASTNFRSRTVSRPSSPPSDRRTASSR